MSEAETKNAFLAAPQAKKMLTLVGLYVGLIAQLCTSVTFSSWLRTAQTEFSDGYLYIFAISVGGILGLIAMPLFGYFGAKDPALKKPLICVSLLLGLIVLLGRAVAPSMIVIAMVSAFWGFVSAGIYVLGFSMIRDMFEQSKVGLYLGLVGTMSSIGMLVGPIAGGMIMQSPIGWRGLNFILAILMAVALVMVFLGVSVKKAEVANMASPSHTFDVTGTIALMVFLGALIIMLSMTSVFPLGSLVSNVLAILALIGLVGLIFDINKKDEKAIVPKKVLKDWNCIMLAISIALCMITSMSLSYFLPQYLPSLRADAIIQAIDPETKGLSMLLPTACCALSSMFLGPVLGKRIAKAGNARGVTTVATIVQIVIFVIFTALFFGVLGKDESGVAKVPYVAILVLMFCAGLYNSRNQVLGAAAPQIQIRPEIRVQANSIVQVGQNLGGGLAMPIFGLVQAVFAAPLIASGMDKSVATVAAIPSAMPWIMVIVTVLSVVLLITGLLLRPLKKDDDK
ncbi:MAG: MFS transporter [Coriobacteriales bacterium]|jgi:MFS family permease|nr:MFS transporter [Coriobacteriales bacterium]